MLSVLGYIASTSSYLKHQLLPVAKFSFYAGNSTYVVVQNVFNLYERCKELLDTNGNGWSDPTTDFSHLRTSIEPLTMAKQSTDDDRMKACANLAMNQNDYGNDEDMLVPLPKLGNEDGEDLSTIWLPLKRKQIFNVNSGGSAFILLRFFVTVTQCYSYQGVNQSIFNRKLKVWVVENVLPYLEDEKLYPAFGGVLRVFEAIKEPNENGYSGGRKKKKERFGFASHPTDLTDDDTFGRFFDADIGVDWQKFAIPTACGVGFLMVTTFVLLRLCKCCGKTRREHSEDPTNHPSFKQRFIRVFRKKPETDERCQYRKLPSTEKTVVFENEKRNKRSKKQTVSLPCLGNAHESDEEIVLHQTPLGKRTPSKSSLSKKTTGESSDGGSEGRTTSPKSQQMPAGPYTKFQSRKPT